MLDEFYTVEQVAKSLKVTERTLKRMIKENKIKALDVSAGEGKRANYRFLKGDVSRFIAEQYLNFDDHVDE